MIELFTPRRSWSPLIGVHRNYKTMQKYAHKLMYYRKQDIVGKYNIN
jgi:hypothetical protein